jgi:hypothetical protein
MTIKPFTVTVPWPSSKLSQNARGAWQKSANVIAKYRRDCEMITHGVIAINGKPIVSFDSAKFEFYPPDNRRRDLQNMIGLMKSGIDDVSFCSITAERMQNMRYGAVRITLMSKEFQPARDN